MGNDLNIIKSKQNDCPVHICCSRYSNLNRFPIPANEVVKRIANNWLALRPEKMRKKKRRRRQMAQNCIQLNFQQTRAKAHRDIFMDLWSQKMETTGATEITTENQKNTFPYQRHPLRSDSAVSVVFAMPCGQLICFPFGTNGIWSSKLIYFVILLRLHKPHRWASNKLRFHRDIYETKKCSSVCRGKTFLWPFVPPLTIRRRLALTANFDLIQFHYQRPKIRTRTEKKRFISVPTRGKMVSKCSCRAPWVKFN